MKIKFKRVLLKISGEALMGDHAFGIDPAMLSHVVTQIKSTVSLGTQLSVVVGGGNIFRGVSSKTSFGVERTSADHMGMLATVLNSLALQGALEKRGVDTRVQTAISMREIAEPYILRRAIRHLEKGRVVIFAAGSGNPYFTTDTAAVLRARETHSDVLLKATKVDGVYDSDPETNIHAKPIRSVKYMDVIERQLRIMDMTAISLAMDSCLPLVVFNIKGDDNVRKVVCGYEIGTIITN